jgi:magnesium-transporting ATPase (P-type)
MNTKKLWGAVAVVFVILEITNYLIHGVMLSSTYSSEGVKEIFRPEEEMMSKMWIMWITDLVWSFFFVFIFVKGYQNKGIIEGVRYGIYIALFMSFTYAYGSYVMYPLPYSLIFQWFLVGLFQCILLGIVTAAIYKPKVIVV